MKRIGFDARFYGHAGPGRYVKALLDHLEKIDNTNEYIVFMNDEGFNSYKPINANFKKVLANSTWYTFQEQTKFLFTVVMQNLDLFYVPHFNIPVLYPGKIVTAIPDMIMHEYSTEAGTTLPIWYFRIKRFVYRSVFTWAILRSFKVIVPTQKVYKEMVEYYPKHKDKFVIAHEGVDPDLLKETLNTKEVLKKYHVEKPYILHVGSMYEHKNVDRIIDMFKLLISKYKYEGDLVLVSKRDKFSERMLERVKAENLTNRVHLPAFEYPSDKIIVISDDEAVAFRKEASVYVFASLKEGFSLTALEGMKFKLPAVISDIDIHREVYEDSVLYFDPTNVEEFAEKVNLMLTDEKVRNDYINRGLMQFKKYDWLETAKITQETFNQALK